MSMLMAMLLRHVLLHSRVSEHTPLECSRTCRPSIVSSRDDPLMCDYIQPTYWTEDWGLREVWLNYNLHSCICAGVGVMLHRWRSYNSQDRPPTRHHTHCTAFYQRMSSSISTLYAWNHPFRYNTVLVKQNIIKSLNAIHFLMWILEP